jgi:aconitate hydratase
VHQSLTRKLIESKIVAGDWRRGMEIGLYVDQTLMTDATGPTIVQELEVLGVGRVATELTVVYVDHNLLQTDFKSADDHEYLRTSAQKMGMWYSPAGNGVSHPVHLERFARPGACLVGGDSHTVGEGAMGMLAFGAGGIDVALATAGSPYFLPVPAVWGVKVTGKLPEWVSTKDIALEMLRRHGVAGGVGRIIEYFGPAVDRMSVWDRHVLANMGMEMGATAVLFPSDERTAEFLEWQGRGEEFIELRPDSDAEYDYFDIVELGDLVPLIAKPHSPDNVVPVSEVAGLPIRQAYLGSSANPSYRDFAIAAKIVSGKSIPPGVSLEVNPSTRAVLAYLVDEGYLSELVRVGARIHQAGCNGCVGIGQAPGTKMNSIRSTPRNFKGRTGTADDAVYLASPETVAASALAGVVTDPRTLGPKAPQIEPPEPFREPVYLLRTPPGAAAARATKVVRGPSITRLPRFEPIPEDLDLPVLLMLGDNISTDQILPAQQDQVQWRSNIERVSDFAFARSHPSYTAEARRHVATGGHAVVAGWNYGQGSAREHAALSPRYLGLRVVVAASFARIYHRNLANFGVLPLRPVDVSDLESVMVGDVLEIRGVASALRSGDSNVIVRIRRTGQRISCVYDLSERQISSIIAGGLLEQLRGTFNDGS